MAIRQKRTIRFGDVDPAGIMFYPRFFDLFHDAFEEFFRAGLGLPYAEVIWQGKLGFPAVRVETDFLKPLRHGEAIEIEVSVAAIGQKSFTCEYRVWRGADLCAKARIVTATVALEGLSGLPVPADLRERLERHRTPAGE